MKSIAFLILGVVILSGCAATVDKKTASELAKLPYPRSAAVGDDLNIVVVQERGLLSDGTLKITNITPQSYHNLQIWLNQQYVGVVKDIPVAAGGQGIHLSLGGFIDSHGRAYPVGRFLTPDKSFPVVLAELFDPATRLRYRLLVEH